MESITAFFKRNWIHFAAVGIFLIVGMLYFSMQMKGYGLKQHDIEQHRGSAHEIETYREMHGGQEPLWTNSMFGGMPTMQVSTIYDGNWFAQLTGLFLKTFPPPMGIVLLYMLCFYMAMSMMKVNRWVAIIGALAFAFLSYDVIILQAGHNSKGVAIAYMLPVVGAFYMAFRRNWMWGAILSAVFMAFEMAANHLQITYYLGFVLVAMGLAEIVRVIKEKNYMSFLKAGAGVLIGYGLALAVNYSNVKMTADYAEYTIRGGNDVTIASNGTSNSANATEGLDRDYVTQYSYGIGESFTLISPYVKGGGSMYLSDSPFAEKVENNDELTSEQLEMVLGSNAYWGDQPIVSGPVYLSVILVLLALLGLIYIRDPMKWALLAATILTLMLSWGKNYMGLTDWFLDHVPGYNKFRAVTIILVIVEMCTVVLAIMFLDQLVKHKDEIKTRIRPLYIASGIFFLFLVILRFSGIEDSYLSAQESDPGLRTEQEAAIRKQIAEADPAQLAQSGIDKNNPAQIQQIIDQQMERFDERFQAIRLVRKDIYNSSMNRSIGFTFLTIACLLLIFHTSLPTLAGVGALGVLAFFDLLFVTTNYLNSEEQGSGYKYWETNLNTTYPISAEEGDLAILEAETANNPELKRIVDAARRAGRERANALEATSSEARRIENAYAFAALNMHSNYRVFDFTGGFNSARASYFHKSLGGYHGAKLRSIQNLYEFHLMQSNNKVFDMLNVKYFLQPDQEGVLSARPNPTAMGNGWFVQSVKVVPDANAEIRALGSQFDMKNAGNGQLIVNGNVQGTAKLYGAEKLQYVLPGRDTISMGLSNGVPAGLKVYIVSDARGTVSTIPAQTMELDTANSFTKLAEYEVTGQFDVRGEAIVRQDMASKLPKKQFKGEGTVRMTSYAPNKLVYDVEASDEGLAVFSEIYYPEGWTATIDGKPADILRVNYVLRGLQVPKGKHKVVFSFDLPKFHKLNGISMIVSLLILLVVAGVSVLQFLNVRRDKNGSHKGNV